MRADQAEYEKLNENLALQRHVIKSYAVWDLPDAPSSFGTVVEVPAQRLADFRRAHRRLRVSAAAPPDEQARTNGRYDLTYTYQNNGANVNLTGSPDYAARIVYVGDPGSGCSDDQYRAVQHGGGHRAEYGSVGLESGRNLLGGCPEQDGRPRDRQEHPPGRQPLAAVPSRRVQRVQHRRSSTIARGTSSTAARPI